MTQPPPEPPEEREPNAPPPPSSPPPSFPPPPPPGEPGWGAPPPPPPPPPGGGQGWGPPPSPGQWQGPPPGPTGPSGPRADFGARLIGALIDGAILFVVNFVLRVVTGATIGGILDFVVDAAYVIYLIQTPSGQTVGMRAMNIRTVDAVTGGRVDAGKAVVRYIVGIVSGFACLVGYLWMLWDPEKQTWHDKASGTYVVPTAYYPVERWPG